jgi:hypothetical protein
MISGGENMAKRARSYEAERAAERLVAERLESNGYQVTNMNLATPNHRTYDFLCRKGHIELYIDVKGQEKDIGVWGKPKPPKPNLFYVYVQPIQPAKARVSYVLTQDECNLEIDAYWTELKTKGTRRGKPTKQKGPDGFRKEQLVRYAEEWHKLPGWSLTMGEASGGPLSQAVETRRQKQGRN